MLQRCSVGALGWLLLALVVIATATRARAQEDAGTPLQIVSFDAAVQPPSASAEVVEITVRDKSKAEQVRESARAVTVIDVERERRFSADLGTVLARTEGISVRRAGALGSEARLSLNGLSDEQVRVFIDGVPLELAGYPFGVNNVPVELVRRIDVHRGVVPVRLGSDALGGAIELISDEGTRGTHGHLSYQAGSFDTHRLLGSARHYDPKSGLFARAEGFFDHARNDYPIRVSQQGAAGLRPVTVARNNDEYTAGFGSVEAGVVHRPWARRLTLRAFLGDMSKGVPSDPLMTTPYARVHSERRVAGSVLRFESVPLAGFSISLSAGYNRRSNVLRDLASCSYDWIGVCVFDRSPSRGERDVPADTHVQQHSGYARLSIARPIAPGHELRFAFSPTFTRRTGEERTLAAGVPDALDGKRALLTVISGLEYEAELFDGRLQNIAFAKYYAMRADNEDLLPNLSFVPTERSYHRAGAGDALRLRFTEALIGKASYEYATRTPSPDQMYGDPALLLQSNLNLRPETAHNANLSGELDLRETRAGDFRAGLTLFARRIDDLIFQFTTVNGLQYQNIDRARALGLQGNAGWSSPGGWLLLEANATYQDYRNRSEHGEAAMYRDSRMLNQPYLFANARAQLFARGLLPGRDTLSLLWHTNYVHDFFVGWDNANEGGLKLRVPSQVVHSLGINLLLHRGRTTISSSLEVFNLLDERVYDFLRVQLPGRSVAAKFTLDV
jgi:vitamin B12 transporter